MIKFKWLYPFTPTVALAFPPPADFTMRVLHVVGVLTLVAALLAISQPWRTPHRP